MIWNSHKNVKRFVIGLGLTIALGVGVAASLIYVKKESPVLSPHVVSESFMQKLSKFHRADCDKETALATAKELMSLLDSGVTLYERSVVLEILCEKFIELEMYDTALGYLKTAKPVFLQKRLIGSVIHDSLLAAVVKSGYRDKDAAVSFVGKLIGLYENGAQHYCLRDGALYNICIFLYEISEYSKLYSILINFEIDRVAIKDIVGYFNDYFLEHPNEASKLEKLSAYVKKQNTKFLLIQEWDELEGQYVDVIYGYNKQKQIASIKRVLASSEKYRDLMNINVESAIKARLVTLTNENASLPLKFKCMEDLMVSDKIISVVETEPKGVKASQEDGTLLYSKPVCEYFGMKKNRLRFCLGNPMITSTLKREDIESRFFNDKRKFYSCIQRYCPVEKENYINLIWEFDVLENGRSRFSGIKKSESCEKEKKFTECSEVIINKWKFANTNNNDFIVKVPIQISKWKESVESQYKSSSCFDYSSIQKLKSN